MSVQVKVLTAEPRVGDTVEFQVVATDDGRIDPDCVGVVYGDDKGSFCVGSDAMCSAGPGAYGPWTPPEKPNDRFEQVFSHVYDKPGTFGRVLYHPSAQRLPEPTQSIRQHRPGRHKPHRRALRPRTPS